MYEPLIQLILHHPFYDTNKLIQIQLKGHSVIFTFSLYYQEVNTIKGVLTDSNTIHFISPIIDYAKQVYIQNFSWQHITGSVTNRRFGLWARAPEP